MKNIKTSLKQILLAVLMFTITFTQAQNYITHKVQSGETVISIAKKYKITPYDIYKFNPDTKDSVDVNTILIIPKSKVVDVELLTEKMFIGYKDHKVKRKETLYGLASQYNVTQEDIKKHNTFLYAENLKKGDKIKIPVYKTVKKIPKSTDDSVKPYAVQAKEGKWRIAYKFGISVAELEALNPEMGDSLQVGQIINVPNIADNEEKILDENFSYYKVLPKEGFYRLNIKLGLSREQLEILNPELKESGLKAGMILKIPQNTFVSSNREKSSHLNLSDSIQNFNTKHLVVMLPFKLNTVNADSIYEAKLKIKNDRVLSIALDFHSGVLMALDSVKKLGVSVKLDVYDTKNAQTETLSIIRNEDFSGVDAVIGPLMQKNFETAAMALSDNNIPIISPITKEVNLYDNVFQSRPSEELLKEKIIRYFVKDTMIKQVFIVHDSKSIQSANELKNKFPNAKVIASRKDKEGKDQFYVLLDDFMINKDEDLSIFSVGKNLVFLETKSSGLVSNVSSVLNSLNKDQKQIILATTDKNSAFDDESISNIYLSNLQFHYPSIRKDYDIENPDTFATKYKVKYGYLPNSYAVRGFDVTMDVLLRLSVFDNLFDSYKLNSETYYSENKFLYKKKLLGGYYNTAAYIVKYNDLKIVEVE